MSFEQQVIIVGGGPVGMGLAIELGQRGIRVVVVEKYLEPQPIPKGQNLTQRTMEHFYAWGAEKELRAARTIPKEYGIGGMTSYGTLLGDYHYDWLQREIVRPYYFTDNERLPQYATEAVLRKRAAELTTVEFLYGYAVTDLQDGVAGVSVKVENRETRATKWLSGRFVVGCDGSTSTVRERAGMTQTSRDHNRLMALLVFRSTELHQLLARYPGKSFYNVLSPELHGYWLFFGRVNLGNSWFFHAPVPIGTTVENFDFDAYLHKAVGTKFSIEYDYRGLWQLRIAIADHYRKGNVFIAGDAAHSHPPYGGYGVNSGFEDARNLGWKLAAELNGWAGGGLLDSYDAERRPVFESTARDFIETSIRVDGEFLANHDPERDREAFEAAWSARAKGTAGEVGSFAPNYDGSPVVCGNSGAQPTALGDHQHAARAGHHLSPLSLVDGTNVYELLGAGFALLSFGADQHDVEDFRQAAEALRLPFAVVDGLTSQHLSRYGVQLVLVRPDQFVCWTADKLSCPADTILRKVIGKELQA
jgi:2-polyprenyl-6-methoxyphenol hydroxylase-like FAD-dependent oxidoreductase